MTENKKTEFVLTELPPSRAWVVARLVRDNGGWLESDWVIKHPYYREEMTIRPLLKTIYTDKEAAQNDAYRLNERLEAAKRKYEDSRVAILKEFDG